MAFASSLPLERAGASDFHAYIDDEFSIFPADGSARVRARLVKIVEQPVTKNVEQFSLIFRLPAGAALADGIHDVRHPLFGSWAIFLSSVGDGEWRACQACFSRHVRT